MATITEISRKAGLAVSTTADILRGRPGYRQETCELVQRIARETNYRPNWLGKALRDGKSMTIGLLGCLMENASSMMKVNSIEDSARFRGYQILMLNTSVGTLDDVEAHLARLDDLLARKVDGLIVDYVAIAPPAQVLSRLESEGLPVVYMDWAPSDGSASCVTVDRSAGIRQAVEHLIKLQHRRVAIITSEWALTRPNAKMQTYQSELKAAGIDILVGPGWTHTRSPINLETDVCNVVKRQLSKTDQPLPSALILFDDLAAVGAVRGVYEAGLRVPEDISVIGFNDVGIAQVTRPSLTTIHQPRGEVGQAAFKMLYQLMNESAAGNGARDAAMSVSPVPVNFECRLIIRESTAPANSDRRPGVSAQRSRGSE